jgi:hypothetical protein
MRFWQLVKVTVGTLDARNVDTVGTSRYDLTRAEKDVAHMAMPHVFHADRVDLREL